MKKNYEYCYQSALFVSKHLAREGKFTVDTNGKRLSVEDMANKMFESLNGQSHKKLLEKVRAFKNI